MHVTSQGAWIDPDGLLVDLVNAHAGAAPVFEARRIDFWRRGDRTLREACAGDGHALEAVAEAIAHYDATEPPPSAWDARPLAELVTHLVDRFHEPAYQHLDELQQVLDQAVTVPASLREAFGVFRREMVHHMRAEERGLFATLAASGDQVLRAPLQVLCAEHDVSLSQLAAVEAALGAALAAAPSSEALHTFALGLDEVARDLHMHTHLENNVLLPRAFRLSAPAG